MNVLNVSLLQFNIVANDRGANVAKVRAMLDDMARTCAPDIFLLPELWTAPFAPDCPPGNAFSCEGSEEGLAAICEACEKTNSHAIAGSLPWPVPDGVAIRSWLVDDRGEPVDYYDKAHLLSPSGERDTFAAGDRPLFFDLAGFRCTVATCYDIRFPEYARSLALCGAEVLFVDADWPACHEERWRTLMRALALENQFYVVGCNCTGQTGGQSFCGRSMVVSPWGDIVAEAGYDDEILSAALLPSEVRKCRRNIPLARDRRPELYFLD